MDFLNLQNVFADHAIRTNLKSVKENIKNFLINIIKNVEGRKVKLS